MKEQGFFSRNGREDLVFLEEAFREGVYFIERKADQNWLTESGDWTNDPHKAQQFNQKHKARLRIIELIVKKVNMSDCIVTEHIFL